MWWWWSAGAWATAPPSRSESRVARTLRPLNREVEEWRRHRGEGGVARARLAEAAADPHQRGPRVLHHRAHVGEVDVDQPRLHHDVRDAGDPLAEDLVRHPEGLLEREALRDDFEQLVVRDDDQDVDVVLRGRGARVRAVRELRGEAKD